MLYEINIRAAKGQARFVREIASEIASRIACLNGPLQELLDDPLRDNNKI